MRTWVNHMSTLCGLQKSPQSQSFICQGPYKVVNMHVAWPAFISVGVVMYRSNAGILMRFECRNTNEVCNPNDDVMKKRRR